jgi:hypothetical protein
VDVERMMPFSFSLSLDDQLLFYAREVDPLCPYPTTKTTALYSSTIQRSNQILSRYSLLRRCRPLRRCYLFSCRPFVSTRPLCCCVFVRWR